MERTGTLIRTQRHFLDARHDTTLNKLDRFAAGAELAGRVLKPHKGGRLLVFGLLAGGLKCDVTCGRTLSTL